jgi:hypothetical protein
LTRAKQRRTALAKQIAVMEFIDGVFEIEPAQQRIRRHFRSTQDVATAVGLDVREGEQLSEPSVGVGPHPPVQ